jgi:hypothetical protein
VSEEVNHDKMVAEKLDNSVQTQTDDLETYVSQLQSAFQSALTSLEDQVAAQQVQINGLLKKTRPLPPRNKHRLSWPEAFMYSVFYSVALTVIMAILVALICTHVL